MIAVCTLVMSLTACGSKSDAEEEYDRVGMKAVIKDVYDRGEEVFDYRIVRENDGEVWYTFVVNGVGKPADYKYHFSQNHVERSFGHYNSRIDYGIWLFTEDSYKQRAMRRNVLHAYRRMVLISCPTLRIICVLNLIGLVSST